MVVYGRVVQILVQESSGRQLALVQAREQVRGPQSNGQDFYVPIHHRYIKSRQEVESISGAPNFKLGEELLLFLREVPSEWF